MKQTKRLRAVFLILAVLLSNAMCAVVAYSCCELQWGARFAGYSAPFKTAFLYALPYTAGIIICLVIARLLKGRDMR